MTIYRSLDEVPAGFGPSALTIGNFDGVHLGHRRILRRVAALAREHGWKPSALTFNPHPTRIVAPERASRLMTSPEERAHLMSEEDIEQVLILPFDRSVAQLEPEVFVRHLLIERLGVRAVVVGDNFRFGRDHAGNVRLLAEFGERFGFLTEVISAAECRGRTISSSVIRQAIEKGSVAWAARLLGRPYSLTGEVVKGHGIGSKQTVPTLNLATASEVIPSRGVYLTRTHDVVDRRRWNSITNVGYRPTFGSDQELTIETFLLEALEGATPERIRVEFLCRVRDERKFDTPEALKAQILSDVRVARNYFRRLQTWLGGRLAPA
jgi:riboflavin kinase/FMN adenylyltransferase